MGVCYEEERIVAIFEEGALAAVAALGYVMGDAREDQAGEAGYGAGLASA